MLFACCSANCLPTVCPFCHCYSDYVSEVQEKFVPTMLAGYKLWIPAHVVNFALVPNRQVDRGHFGWHVRLGLPPWR